VLTQTGHMDQFLRCKHSNARLALHGLLVLALLASLACFSQTPTPQPAPSQAPVPTSVSTSPGPSQLRPTSSLTGASIQTSKHQGSPVAPVPTAPQGSVPLTLIPDPAELPGRRATTSQEAPSSDAAGSLSKTQPDPTPESAQQLAESSSPDGQSLTDRQVLIAVYESTDGPNWNINDKWLTSAEIGEWYGVTLDETGRVTGLNLAGNDLAGSIPPELGSLPNLNSLRLGQNPLTGCIPTILQNVETNDLPSLDLPLCP